MTRQIQHPGAFKKKKIETGLIIGFLFCVVYGLWSYSFRNSQWTSTSECICVLDPGCGNYQNIRGSPIGGKSAPRQTENDKVKPTYVKVGLECRVTYIVGEQLLALVIGFIITLLSSRRVETK
jgi:hypothetical protein